MIRPIQPIRPAVSGARPAKGDGSSQARPILVAQRLGWIVPQRVRPAQAAGRGEALVDFQLVCGAGPYELDVLLREQAKGGVLDIVGQVTLAESIYEPVARLRLDLVEAAGSETVASTETDNFGEFDLASERESMFGLRLGDASDAPCVLIWEGEES